MKRLLTIAVALVLIAGFGTARADAFHGGTTALIDTWYHRFLGRCPDPLGYNFWGQELRQRSPESALAYLVASEEYYHRNGCSPHGFVAGLYRDVLGVTNVPSTELHGWVHHLQHCGSRETLAQQFLQAANVDVLAFASPVTTAAYSPPPMPVAAYQPPVIAYRPPVVQTTPVVVTRPPVIINPVPAPVFVRPIAPRPGFSFSLRIGR